MSKENKTPDTTIEVTNKDGLEKFSFNTNIKDEEIIVKVLNILQQEKIKAEISFIHIQEKTNNLVVVNVYYKK